MGFLVVLGVLAISQAIVGIPSFSDFIKVGLEGKLPDLSSLIEYGVRPHYNGGEEVLENTVVTPTDFKANLSSCLQFFFDVQEVPHAFAGLSDALYNASTSGAPLVKSIITCTHLTNFVETIGCLQELEPEMKDFYVSLHPLFIPAYDAFKEQLVKVKSELDSCLRVSSSS